MQLTKREKRILVVAAIVVSLGVVYYGLWVPFKVQKNFSEEAMALEVKIRNEQRALEKYRALERKYVLALASQRQQYSDSQVTSALLSEISAVAAQKGIRIIEIKPQAVRKGDSQTEFKVKLALDAELPDIMRFMAILQNSPHLLKVDNMMLTRRSPQEQALRCELTLGRTLMR
jgi:hypothetical protein